MKVLLIEDDKLISAVIKKGLEQAHFKVETSFDGAEGLELATLHPYSLIILDIQLPGLNGFGVCTQLRERKIRTPILMLTARDAVTDRIHGLEIGADDYLPKPFDFRELLARVRAILRRDSVHKTPLIKVADLEVNATARTVTRAGKEIGLTPREFSLLEALAAHEGQVLTREIIQEQVWLDEFSYSNTVDAHIKSLRKKVDSEHPVKLIQTAHGVGYCLKVPENEPVTT